MREPDINEVMAQSAPSQNPEIAPQGQSMTSMIAPTTPTEFVDAEQIGKSLAQQMADSQEMPTADQLRAAISQNRNRELMSSISQSLKEDPNQAGEAQRVAEQMNVSPDLARRNLQDFNRLVRMREIEQLQLQRTSPVLAERMRDSQFAAIAHDDLGNLIKSEELWQAMPKTYTPWDVVPASWKGQLLGGFQRAALQADEKAPFRELYQNFNAVSDEREEELRKQVAGIRAQTAMYGDNISGAIASPTYMASQMLFAAPTVAKYAVTGGVVGGAMGATGFLAGPTGAVTTPAGFATGVGVGAQLGFAADSFESNGASIYFDMRDKGYDRSTAMKIAVAAGTAMASVDVVSLKAATAFSRAAIKNAVVESVIERLIPEGARKGVGAVVAAAAKPLESLAARQAAKEFVAKPTLRQALRTSGTEIIKSAGIETLGEMTQDSIAYAVELAAYSMAEQRPSEAPATAKQFGSQLVDTAIETMMGAWVFAAPGAAAHIASSSGKIRQAEQTREFFTTLSDLAANAKVRERNNNAFQDWIARNAEGRAGATIYVDAARMNEVLQQANLPAEAVDQLLPGVRQQVAAAVNGDTGADVTIDTSQFAAKVAGTKLGDAMIPHIRATPDAISWNDAPAVDRARSMMEGTVKREAMRLLEERKSKNGEFVESAQKVQDAVKRQLLATGQMTEADADQSATIVRDFAVVMAARHKMTPEAFHEKFGLRVQGAERQAAPVGVMEQPGQFDQAGQRRTDTPEFSNWFGESKVVDAEGKPLVVYHGTNAQGFTAFDPTRSGSNVGRKISGFYFSDERGNAQGYGENVMPAYISMQNPLVVDFDGANWDGTGIDEDTDEEFVAGPSIDELVEQAKREGYDGVIALNVSDVGADGDERLLNTTYVSLRPEQIKSPNNRGTWSRESANMFEQSAIERLQMEAERGRRKQARAATLTEAEEAAVTKAATTRGESADEIRKTILKHKMANPHSQGWAELEFIGLKVKNKDNAELMGIGLDKHEFLYREIPYGFSDGADGTAMEVGSEEYKSRVNAISRRMVEEVRKVLQRANAGDQNAARIIEQSTWYAAMRQALRREFGGLGDLMADMLGATSPNTPVRGNWAFSIDILRRAMRGDFDDLMVKWEAWSDEIERRETELRAYLNEQTQQMEARGEKATQVALKETPEYARLLAELKEARELPDELLPRQENGKKYGFNGEHVVRAMLGLWRTVREQNALMDTSAQAPKALNFSGNLIGFRQGATIDVWAARMLQRLAGLLRIPSMAEGGVSGVMLPDGRTTLQFGFGQDVFAEAAKRIRDDAELKENSKLAQIRDDDLQALVWFIEKELWTINDWTSVAGEGGSFDLEASLTGSDQQERIEKLREIINAGVPGKIQAMADSMVEAQKRLGKWMQNPAKEQARTAIAALQAESASTQPSPTKKRQAEIKKEIAAIKQKSGLAVIEEAIAAAAKAQGKIEKQEEGRTRARAELISLERRVDRYTAGLSQQKSMDSQGVDYVPTDADQARLADKVRTRAYQNDPGERIVAVKTGSTEGRYGSIERSLDLEVVARANWDPTELWRVMVEEARDANQESTFLSRVLREGEAVDPTKHRPGLEIYFKSPVPRDKLDALIQKLNQAGVDFFTVIVDARRSSEARSGAMSDAVGIRMQYVPEYMHRYGIEELAGLSDSELAAKMQEREVEWLALARQATQAMPEISFTGVFWHETRVAFADAYQEELNAIAAGTAQADGGQVGGTVWGGRSVREGVAAADRFRSAKAAQSQPDGGGQVSGGVQEGSGVFEQSPVLRFHSALWSSVESMSVPDAGLTAQGWKERIQGLVNKGVIKDAELEWSGFLEYLEAQPGKITKDQIISAFEDKGGVVRVDVERDSRLYGDKLMREARADTVDRLLSDLAAAQVQLTPEQQAAMDRYAATGEMPRIAGRSEFREAKQIIDDLIQENQDTLSYDSVDSYLEDSVESLEALGQETQYDSHTVHGEKEQYTTIRIELPVQRAVGGKRVVSEYEAKHRFSEYWTAGTIPDAEKKQIVEYLDKLLPGSLREFPGLKGGWGDVPALTIREMLDSGIPSLVDLGNTLSAKPDLGTPAFVDQHWDQPNVLCFVRYTIRKDAAGKRILFVEEVQSDWAHEARERGVASRSPEVRDAIRLADRKASTTTDLARGTYEQGKGKTKAAKDEQRNIFEAFWVSLPGQIRNDLAGMARPEGIAINWQNAPTFLNLYDVVTHPGIAEDQKQKLLNDLGMPEILFEQLKQNQAALAELEAAKVGYLPTLDAVQQGRGSNPVPNAPFIESTDAWMTLALKQVVMEAQQEGVDSIVFSDAGVHIDRWGSQEFMWKAVGKGEWEVYAASQIGGNAMGMDLEAEAVARGLASKETRIITSERELRLMLNMWNETEMGKNALAAKVWKRMQTETAGHYKPRADAMWAFYGNADGINPKTGKPSILRLNMEKLGKKLGGAKIAKGNIPGQLNKLQAERVGGPAQEAVLGISEAMSEVFRNEKNAVEWLHSADGQVFVERLHDRFVSDRHIAASLKSIPNVGQLTTIVQKAWEGGVFGWARPSHQLSDLLERVEKEVGNSRESITGLEMVLSDAAKAKVNEGLPLFQAATGPGPRGTFDPKRLLLTLNTKADMSTFLHEAGHYFLTVMSNMAAMPDATPEMRADMDKLLAWFGIAGATPEERLAKWNAMSLDEQRPFHEQFAYNFEIYLSEGRAPSVELLGAFESFAMWLKRVYKTIRDDLNEIYRANFGRDLPILTGEVRQVMDRMLATDEEIARTQAINSMRPMFQTQEEAGVDDATWAAYVAMDREATQQAVSEHNAANMSNMRRLGMLRNRILADMRGDERERRAGVRKEIQRKVAAMPIYRAMRYLRNGESEQPDGTVTREESGFRMSRAGVDEVVNAQTMAIQTGEQGVDPLKLPRWCLADEGQHPDVIAQRFGFDSGHALLRALTTARPMNEMVEAMTDAEMQARYGDMDSPQAREQAVAKALHNEARAMFITAEYRLVTKATQPARIIREAARQVARQMISERKIRDLRAGDYTAAEARAARDAENAHQNRVTPEEAAKRAYSRVYGEQLPFVAAGMPESEAVARATKAAEEARAKAESARATWEAKYGKDTPSEEVVIRAKRQQLLQNQLSGQALEAVSEIKKAVRYLREVLSDKNRKRIGAEAADQIELLLEAVNLRPMSNRESDLRMTLAAYIAKLEEDGISPDIPAEWREGLKKPYRELTVGQFRDLVSAIKTIEYIAKNRNKIEIMRQRMEFEAMRDGIVLSIDVNRRGGKKFERDAANGLERIKQGGKAFFGRHMKAATIIRILDGGQDNGPVWRYLGASANQAANRETTMRAKATQAVVDILAPVFAMGKMEGNAIQFDSIGRSLNRAQRLALALNMGNAGNIQRVLDGEGWTMEQIQPVLESLTAAEWNAVQGIWDHMESYRPMIAAKERRLYGKEPEWVEPQALTIRTSDGQTLNLRGGYYPISYDRRATVRASRMGEVEEAARLLKDAYTAATTRRGFTKNRAERVENMPVSLTLDALFGGLNDVIHDLCWHEWLIQTNRLMNDSKFQTAVRESYGVEFYKQLKSWVERNARGDNVSSSGLDAAARAISRNIAAVGLGYQILNSIMQVTGFANSVVRIGATWVGHGIKEYITSPRESVRMVQGKSEFMRNRARTQFKELAELKNMVRGQTKSERSWRAGVYVMMTYMQRTVDVPTWMGAYDKAMQTGVTEDEAIAIADQAVIDSQGSGLLTDQSAMESGGGLHRLYTVFYSYMNTVLNQAIVSGYTAKTKGKMAADMLMLLVVPVVLNRVIRDVLVPSGDDDDEKFWQRLARRAAEDQVAYLFGLFVGVRELNDMAKIVTGGRPMGYSGPTGMRMVSDISDFAVQAVQFEADSALRKSFVNVLGDFTGIPSVQINRTWDGIEALVDGKTESPLAPLTGYQERKR